MLSGRDTKWGIVGFLLVLSVWIAAATLSPSYQECESRYQNDYAKEHEDGAPPSIKERIGILIICESETANENGAAITAFATIALVASTLLLWYVTSTAAQAAKDSADTLPIVERAYAFPLIVNTSGFDESIQAALKSDTDLPDRLYTAEVSFVIKNLGKTPAVLQSVSTRIWVSSRPNTRFQPDWISDSILGAGEVGAQKFNAIMRRVLSAVDARELIQANWFLHFEGVIVFRDIWNSRCVTRFVFTWVPHRKNWTVDKITTRVENERGRGNNSEG